MPEQEIEVFVLVIQFVASAQEDSIFISSALLSEILQVSLNRTDTRQYHRRFVLLKVLNSKVAFGDSLAASAVVKEVKISNMVGKVIVVDWLLVFSLNARDEGRLYHFIRVKQSEV